VKNDDETSSGGELSVTFSDVLENTKGSLLGATKKLSLRGETGNALLDGNVESRDQVEVTVGKASVSGQIIAENQVNITTTKQAQQAVDFDVRACIE